MTIDSSLVGSSLGHYRVVAAIGAGGMGEVYRSTDAKLERDVAIAIEVLPSAFTEDRERLARFQREAKLLSSLNHADITHVYGFESATLEDRRRAPEGKNAAARSSTNNDFAIIDAGEFDGLTNW
jgi:serine/threonine protein kinase